MPPPERCERCRRELRRNDYSSRLTCGDACRSAKYRARLAQERGQTTPRPRGRPRNHPVPRSIKGAALRRLAEAALTRATQAEQRAATLQQRCDEQARELDVTRPLRAELDAARARIAELERQLATSQQNQRSGEVPPPQDGEQDGRPDYEEPPPAVPPVVPPRRSGGIQEVRRQLAQARAANEELRAVIEDLRGQITTGEGRRTELENLLQQALRSGMPNPPIQAGVTWSVPTAAAAQQRAAVLLTEREQLLRHRREDADQIERLTSRVLTLILPSGNLTPSGTEHDIRQSDLFRQLREEIVVRERYSTWQQINRQIVRDRPVTATRTREEEAAEAVLAVRRMHMFRPALHFTGNPRWVVDGVLLDPESERFLVRSSRQRILYRERMMAGQTPDV